MIQQKLQKSSDGYFVTVPKDEVERRRLHEGQLLGIDILPLEIRPQLRPELGNAFEQSWDRNQEAYRLLADAEADDA